MTNLLVWINIISKEAYRHGQGYGKCNIYRNVGKFIYKHPECCCGYDIHKLPLDDHEFLARLYRHSFRQGMKSIK
jgi:hypothetical protein